MEYIRNKKKNNGKIYVFLNASFSDSQIQDNWKIWLQSFVFIKLLFIIGVLLLEKFIKLLLFIIRGRKLLLFIVFNITFNIL